MLISLLNVATSFKSIFGRQRGCWRIKGKRWQRDSHEPFYTNLCDADAVALFREAKCLATHFQKGSASIPQLQMFAVSLFKSPPHFDQTAASPFANLPPLPLSPSFLYLQLCSPALLICLLASCQSLLTNLNDLPLACYR